MTKNKKILIIDDVFQIRHNLTQFFSECGYFAFNANCGINGLEICEKITPDLLILDYNLRDMDCFQFLERLRKYENNLKDVVQVSNIPVIIISGYLTEEKLRPVAKKYGISGYLHKPLNLTELLHEAELVLGEKKKFSLEMTRDIIVMDSELRTAKFIAGYLGQFNFNITICLGPYDFIEMLPEIKPDLVIFDCFMNFEKLEKFDLYELVKKANPKAKIFLTSFCPNCKLKSTFKLMGYDKLFSKPIDLMALESEVLNLLKKSPAAAKSAVSQVDVQQVCQALSANDKAK
jgi:DNA-binding response OmpR family regulator